MAVMLKKVDIMKSLGESVTPRAATCVLSTYNPLMANLEKLLMLWIESQACQHIPFFTVVLRGKAQTLWEDLCNCISAEEHITFKANFGWSDCFKTHDDLHSLKLMSDAAGANLEAASRFPDFYKKVVENDGYSLKSLRVIDTAISSQ